METTAGADAGVTTAGFGVAGTELCAGGDTEAADTGAFVIPYAPKLFAGTFGITIPLAVVTVYTPVDVCVAVAGAATKFTDGVGAVVFGTTTWVGTLTFGAVTVTVGTATFGVGTETFGTVTVGTVTFGTVTVGTVTLGTVTVTVGVGTEAACTVPASDNKILSPPIEARIAPFQPMLKPPLGSQIPGKITLHVKVLFQVE